MDLNNIYKFLAVVGFAWATSCGPNNQSTNGSGTTAGFPGGPSISEGMSEPTDTSHPEAIQTITGSGTFPGKGLDPRP